MEKTPIAGRFDQVSICVARVVHATSFSGFCVSGRSARIERNETKVTGVEYSSDQKNSVGNIYSQVPIVFKRPSA